MTSHFVPTHTIKTDRRRKPRLRCNYPAIVRGWGPDATKFQEPATLCDLSAAGLYLRMKREIERGTKLFVCFRMSKEPVQAPSLAIRGIVVRTEPQTDGTCGVGLRLERYHVL